MIRGSRPSKIPKSIKLVWLFLRQGRLGPAFLTLGEQAMRKIKIVSVWIGISLIFLLVGPMAVGKVSTRDTAFADSWLDGWLDKLKGAPGMTARLSVPCLIRNHHPTVTRKIRTTANPRLKSSGNRSACLWARFTRNPVITPVRSS